MKLKIKALFCLEGKGLEAESVLNRGKIQSKGIRPLSNAVEIFPEREDL